MVSVYMFLLICVVITIGRFDASALQFGCNDPDERCLPIRHCPPVYKRVVNQEHKRNITFRKELKSKICEPVEKMDIKTHICCPRSDIECSLNGERGACLQREQCPTLQSTTERHLMRSIEKNLCYVHEKKNYFCCTDPLCVSIKTLCDQQPKTKLAISAFPNCTSSNGVVGSLVPKRVCSDQKHSVANGRVCCVPPNPDRLISHRKAAKLAALPCGTIGLVTKIYNGTFAERGEFPWMVKLVYNTKHVCSGTLIHPQYVLTARHCFNVQPTKVQLGKHDLRVRNEPGVQEIRISKMFRNNRYDIGLLLLAKPATIGGDYVRPICLPVYSSLRMYLPQTVTISGWGLTETKRAANVLMKADTPVLMSGERCNEEHMICIGGVNNINHCAGDSGGPYQALSRFGNNSGGRYVQYGIISDGPAYCENPNRPSRGVLVGYVIDWILDQMELIITDGALS